MSQGLNGRLAFAIAAGAIGSGFQHGYNTGVLNAPQDLIMRWVRHCDTGSQPEDVPTEDLKCDLSNEAGTIIWAWVVAIFCIGGMLGGSTVGILSSKVGRKGTLIWNNVLAILAGIIMFFSKMSGHYSVLLIGRFVIGVNSGINAGLSPMYLSEIAPTSLRGAVGTVYQLIITISILLSQILGMKGLMGTESGWVYLLGLTIVPAILQLVMLPLCPESPKYLLLDCDDEEKAASALTWFRGSVDIHDEIDEMKIEKESIKNMKKVTFKEMLVNGTLRRPLIIANMMMLAQQLSGINAIMYYSTSIFLSAKLTIETAQYATLAMGAMNVGMTVISLLLIEKAGRKTLMLIGLSVMLVTTVVLMISLLNAESVKALSFLAIVMVILFVVGFATGPGSIPWFFVTELFNQSARGMATSIAVVVNWTANFSVGLLFAPIQLWLGPYVFVIFIVLQALFALYVKLQVPETKNKTVEEISAQFRR